MNVAAGVLLILAAVFNGCAGGGYMMGGAASSAAGVVGSRVGDELAKDSKTSVAENAGSMKAMATTAKATGVGLMAFGLFLLAMLGLQIAAAVVLFMKKAKTFIIVIAGLGILAEVIGVLLTSFGWTNVVGLLAGILALVALRSFRVPTSPPNPEAAI
jgi:hypothetical protein